MNLAAHRVWRLSGNYFEPCRYTYRSSYYRYIAKNKVVSLPHLLSYQTGWWNCVNHRTQEGCISLGISQSRLCGSRKCQFHYHGGYSILGPPATFHKELMTPHPSWISKCVTKTPNPSGEFHFPKKWLSK